MQDLDTLSEQAQKDVEVASTTSELEQVRVHYMGKQGIITSRLKSLSKLSKEDRPVAGAKINKLKVQLNDLLLEKRKQLDQQALLDAIKKNAVDVSLPGRNQPYGSLHPVTLTLERIERFFSSVGFEMLQGPEVEDDFHNFTALNIPQNHPARAMQDTFYLRDDNVSPGWLLRTHTSPVQIRAMLERSAPLQIMAMGKVFRCDSDLTHTPMFHQCEGLMVGENISFASLKGLLIEFLQHFFDKELQVRFRPSYFPFTEPSAEVDIMGAKGWMEVLGCGMVHPNVLKNVNINAEKYTGFAWGMGIERFAMLRYGIDDIRMLFENDLQFLQQFA